MSLSHPKFSSIAIFLEKRKTRQYVGKLLYSKKDRVFELIYDKDYLYAKNAIPLGPELPLTRAIHRSARLFPSFQDRIPSQENPAYPDYCKATGISPDENDPIILLGTIGKKGPSSFIFEPFYETQFSKEDLRAFRENLGLTIREFALCFDLSPAALIRIETGQSSGRELLKRIEIYKKFPEVALFEIQRHGGAISSSKKNGVLRYLEELRTSLD